MFKKIKALYLFFKFYKISISKYRSILIPKDNEVTTIFNKNLDNDGTEYFIFTIVERKTNTDKLHINLDDNFKFMLHKND